jgi:hypothetical protein
MCVDSENEGGARGSQARATRGRNGELELRPGPQGADESQIGSGFSKITSWHFVVCCLLSVLGCCLFWLFVVVCRYSETTTTTQTTQTTSTTTGVNAVLEPAFAQLCCCCYC